MVTHLFACLSPAYVGWRWAVTVTRAARAKQVTVGESMLLPGPDSLLAPAWVPWTERVRPGDLRAGDLMPAAADDERLIPSVVIEGAEGLLDWDASDTWTLGAGAAAAEPGEPGEPEPGAAAAAAAAIRPTERTRPSRRRHRRAEAGARPVRVLSAIGRDEAASRWYSGDFGPESPLASAAPDACVTCGFLIRLGGPLGRIFGVCANEFAPADGHVVAFDYGCGAHSDPGRQANDDGLAEPQVDELGYEMMNQPGTLPEDAVENVDPELG